MQESGDHFICSVGRAGVRKAKSRVESVDGLLQCAIDTVDYAGSAVIDRARTTGATRGAGGGQRVHISQYNPASIATKVLRTCIA